MPTVPSNENGSALLARAEGHAAAMDHWAALRERIVADLAAEGVDYPYPLLLPRRWDALRDVRYALSWTPRGCRCSVAAVWSFNPGHGWQRSPLEWGQALDRANGPLDLRGTLDGQAVALAEQEIT